MLNKRISNYIETLQLEPHPEGGYFKETYRSELQYIQKDLPTKRNISTGIYFLITKGNFSAFHRIKSDEMWHFYDGDPLLVHIIHPNGKYEVLKVGLNMQNNEKPQGVVPAGAWFASETLGDFSLVGCTVAPGFDFEDFKLGQASHLEAEFPEHTSIIRRLCRPT